MDAGETDYHRNTHSELNGQEFERGSDSPQPHPSNWDVSTISSNESVQLIGDASLSDSTYLDGPTAHLKSTESLVSVTSASKTSERSISLTPPEKNYDLSFGSHLYTTRKFVVGIIIVLSIALSWVGSTQTAKSAYTSTRDFNAPFFMMWFGTSWMIVVFPFSAVLHFGCSGNRKCGWSEWTDFLKHSLCVFSPEGITVVSIITSTVPFTLIWVSVNYMYIQALNYIEASDVTAMFSSAPAFVFILSLVLLKEPLLLLRLVSVVLAICGIALFAYQDGFAAHRYNLHSLLGIGLAVGAAVGAALYKVLLKVRLKEATIYQMSLFLTSIGLFSTLFLWPVVLILHLTHHERLDVEIPWFLICASSAFSLIFNFSINFGIAYTYPLFISLGTVLGIPINAVVDVFARHVDILNWKFTGVDLIVGGFLLMLLPPSDSYFVHHLFTCKFLHRKKGYQVIINHD